MKSSISAAALLLAGFSAVTSASKPLYTIEPCPSCPKSAKPPAITVTSQYQPVSTCTPHKVSTKSGYKVEAECSTYDWVSTVIPCDGGLSTTTVTKTEQTVRLGYVSTVLTSLIPYPTKAPLWNGTAPAYGNGTSTTSYSTKYETMVVDTWCPFKDIGPFAIPGYPGSGLCKTCGADKNGTKSQGVTVKKCLDGKCSTYPETWVSTKPAPATSTSQVSYSSSTYCPSSGIYTIPVTTTCTPSGPEFTKPVTKTFSITTSVDNPQTIEITKTVYITFTGKPAATVSSSSSACPLSTSKYCTSNGVVTIPISTVVTPTAPGYTIPVTTTVYYTTTVTDAPRHVGCTTTVTVTFTSYACPATVVSGTTYTPTSYPATVSATSTTSAIAYPMSTPPSYSAATGPTSTLKTSAKDGVVSSTSYYATGTSTPHPVPSPGECEYAGCYGSPSGFPSFTLVETSGSMTVELCTSECLASGHPYSGLYSGECYCASTLDSCSESSDKCDLPCPGNHVESCGGNIFAAKMLRARAVANTKLFDIYECPLPTTTTKTSDGTSSTTSATPDPSSDADAEEEKRSLDADMEASQLKVRGIKLRRGGMLRAEKKEKANLLTKRDFGLKKPFGL